MGGGSPYARWGYVEPGEFLRNRCNYSENSGQPVKPCEENGKRELRRSSPPSYSGLKKHDEQHMPGGKNYYAQIRQNSKKKIWSRAWVTMRLGCGRGSSSGMGQKSKRQKNREGGRPTNQMEEVYTSRGRGKGKVEEGREKKQASKVLGTRDGTKKFAVNFARIKRLKTPRGWTESPGDPKKCSKNSQGRGWGPLDYEGKVSCLGEETGRHN